MKKCDSCTVYVGNVRVSRLSPHSDSDILFQIPPMATDSMLREYLVPCGAIGIVIIRCTAGVPLTGDFYENTSSKDEKYATVTFKSRNSVHKALKMDGRSLKGYSLKVNLTFNFTSTSDIKHFLIYVVRYASVREIYPSLLRWSTGGSKCW